MTITWPQNSYLGAIEAANEALECFEAQGGEPLLWAAYKECRRALKLFPAYVEAVKEQSGHDLDSTSGHVHDQLSIILGHLDALAEAKASGSVGEKAEQLLRRARIVAELENRVRFLVQALEHRKKHPRSHSPTVKGTKVTPNWLFELIGKRTGVTRRAVQKIYEDEFTADERAFVTELMSSFNELRARRPANKRGMTRASANAARRPPNDHPWRR